MPGAAGGLVVDEEAFAPDERQARPQAVGDRRVCGHVVFLLVDLAPADPMEKSGMRTVGDECIPLGGLVRNEIPHGDRTGEPRRPFDHRLCVHH